jgi:hypothetical protein
MNKKWFQEVEKYDDDLAAFEKQLSDANINFRVFNISVPIRAAKWSEAFAPAPTSPDSCQDQPCPPPAGSPALAQGTPLSLPPSKKKNRR